MSLSWDHLSFESGIWHVLPIVDHSRHGKSYEKDTVFPCLQLPTCIPCRSPNRIQSDMGALEGRGKRFPLFSLLLDISPSSILAHLQFDKSVLFLVTEKHVASLQCWTSNMRPIVCIYLSTQALQAQWLMGCPAVTEGREGIDQGLVKALLSPTWSASKLALFRCTMAPSSTITIPIL